MSRTLVDDFSRYWAFQAMVLDALGRTMVDPEFDRSALEPLTRGLAARGRRSLGRLPLVLARLRYERRVHEAVFAGVDLLLSPTVNHPPPELGFLSTAEPYRIGFPRLVDYVGFTPLANVAGTPAISLPHATTADGLPLSVMFGARSGDERTLLEAAFEVERAAPFPSLVPPELAGSAPPGFAR